MNTDKIKKEIEELIGTSVILKINIGRNRFENYFGIVDCVYPYLFTVKTNDDIKTISYVDVLTKNVVVIKN